MKFFLNLKIKTRLFLSITFIVLFSMLAMLFVVSDIAANQQEKAVMENGANLTEKYANEFRLYLENAVQVARSTARMLEHMSNNEPDRNKAVGLISAVLKGNPEFVGIATCWEENMFDKRDAEFVNAHLHDSTGRFIPYFFFDGGVVKTEPLKGYSTPGEGDWYLNPKEENNETISEPYIYSVGGKDVMMTTISVPVRKNGRFAGVVTVDIALDSIHETVEKIRPYETGYAIVLSNGTRFVSHPAKGVLRKTWKEIDKGYESMWGEKIRKGIVDNFWKVSTENGSRSRYFLNPIKIGNTSTPWCMAISIPEEKILEGVKKLQSSLIVSAIGAILFILVVLYLISTSIVKGINRVNNMMHEISEGDGDLTARIDFDSKDEVGELARNFNGFVETIETLVKSIKSSVYQVRGASEEVSSGNDQLSSSTQEMASSLEETAASITEITNSIIRTASDSSIVSEDIRKTSIEAVDGSKMLSDMEHAMEEVKMSGEKINEIVNVVNDIAFQTNLLALNAAVEAARAGEEGKGFAVVAGEVRSLAGRSAEAASEIKKLIENNGINIERANTLSHKTTQTLQRVTDNIREASEAVNDIELKAKDQAGRIEQINAAVRQMDEVTQRNAALVEELAASAQDMSGVAGSLSHEVEQFKVGDSSNPAVYEKRKPAIPAKNIRRPEYSQKLKQPRLQAPPENDNPFFDDDAFEEF